ncbi:MAG: ABC transporter permease [Anaerolineae bacterium]|nr:ABC transporter permease [Anaerolineae bacterium]
MINKILRIALKDLRILFADRAAVLMMLAAPLVLTLGMGFVTGSFSDDGNGNSISDIPVTVINNDEGDFGRILANTFAAPELDTLFAVTTGTDLAAAKQAIDDDQAAAVVIIPAGFSDSIMPDPATGAVSDALPVEVYSNPARPISAGVVQSIVADFTQQVTTGVVSGRVLIEQMIAASLIAPDEVPAVAAALGQQLQTSGGSLNLIGQEAPVIRLNSAETTAAQPDTFDPIAFFAPAMALLFLMYTVTRGAQSILTERDEGTMSRILTTPTSVSQVLGGKTFGTFLSGVVQVGLLIVGTAILFQLNWGSPLGVTLLIIFVAAAATGWGMLIAAVARTPGQAASIGTALMLLFAILSGTFFGPSADTPFINILGSITPNKWALDGFVELASGGTVADIVPMLIALTIMAVVLFVIAVIVFSKQWRTSR